MLGILYFIDFKQFLKEIQCYKHIFINKFKKLEKLDGEGITQFDKEASEEFVRNLNEKYYYERPNSAQENQLNPDIKNLNNDEGSRIKNLEHVDQNIKINKSAQIFFSKINHKASCQIAEKANNHNADIKANEIGSCMNEMSMNTKLNVETNKNAIIVHKSTLANGLIDLNKKGGISFKINKNSIKFSEIVRNIL